jgi:hypothetical protein
LLLFLYWGKFEHYLKSSTYWPHPPDPLPLEGKRGSSFKRGRSPLFSIPPPRLPGEGD